jgi:hypothetical protein
LGGYEVIGQEPNLHLAAAYDAARKKIVRSIVAA